jgi:DNA-binding GntR family transcriptional regulator
MSKSADNGPLGSVRSEYRSITDTTCDKLREAIIQGVFAPGEALKERELADWMSVSTTPVKAALQRLALEGLVTTVPMRGSHVANDIPTTLSEFGLIRAGLEGTAAHMAAKKVTAEDVAMLREQIETMRSTLEEGDVDRLIEANTRFHELIHTFAHNSPLTMMLEVVRRYDEITRPQMLADQEQAKRGLTEHAAVCEAIAAGDPERADEKMREHIMRTVRALEDLAPDQAPYPLSHP